MEHEGGNQAMSKIEHAKKPMAVLDNHLAGSATRAVISVVRTKRLYEDSVLFLPQGPVRGWRELCVSLQSVSDQAPFVLPKAFRTPPQRDVDGEGRIYGLESRAGSLGWQPTPVWCRDRKITSSDVRCVPYRLTRSPVSYVVQIPRFLRPGIDRLGRTDFQRKPHGLQRQRNHSFDTDFAMPIRISGDCLLHLSLIKLMTGFPSFQPEGVEAELLH